MSIGPDGEVVLMAAISQCLEENGWLQDGELLGDWHVMCEVTSLSPDNRGKTRYVNIIPGNNGTPMHRVVGLIQVCTDMLETTDEPG